MISSASPLNEELTRTMNEREDHKLFIQWCNENGLIWSGVNPLSYFGEGMRGIAASRDIMPFEGVLYVPNKVLITIKKIAKDEEFLPLIEGIKEFKDFEERVEENEEMLRAKFLTLLLYTLFQKGKGKNSFWYPYLQMLGTSEAGFCWPQEDLEKLEAPSVMPLIEQERKLMDEPWPIISPIMETHPECFQGLGKADFYWAYQVVESRYFAYCVPSEMITPGLCMVNHDNSDMFGTYSINVSLERQQNKEILEELEYEPFKKNYDIRGLVPDAQFGEKTIDSKKMYFIKKAFELYGEQDFLVDPRLITVYMEDSLCELLIERIALDYPQIQIWELPPVIEDKSDGMGREILKRSNDLIEQLKGQDRSLPDYKTQEKEILNSKLAALKVKIGERMSNGYTRELPLTPDLQVGDIDDVDQNTFKWFEGREEDTYFSLVSIKDKVIKKGEQLFFCYGSFGNDHTLGSYGFALEQNHYNYFMYRLPKSKEIEESIGEEGGLKNGIVLHTSIDHYDDEGDYCPGCLPFRDYSNKKDDSDKTTDNEENKESDKENSINSEVDKDRQDPDEKDCNKQDTKGGEENAEEQQEKGITDKLYAKLSSGRKVLKSDLSQLFYTSFHQFDRCLAHYLREHLWNEFSSSKGYSKKVRDCFILSAPFSAEYEIHVLSHYRSIFQIFMDSFKSTDVDFENIKHSKDSSYREITVATCNLGYYLLAKEQLDMCDFILSLLNRIQCFECPSAFRKAYMEYEGISFLTKIRAAKYLRFMMKLIDGETK